MCFNLSSYIYAQVHQAYAVRTSKERKMPAEKRPSGILAYDSECRDEMIVLEERPHQNRSERAAEVHTEASLHAGPATLDAPRHTYRAAENIHASIPDMPSEEELERSLDGTAEAVPAGDQAAASADDTSSASSSKRSRRRRLLAIAIAAVAAIAAGSYIYMRASVVPLGPAISEEPEDSADSSDENEGSQPAAGEEDAQETQGNLDESSSQDDAAALPAESPESTAEEASDSTQQQPSASAEDDAAAAAASSPSPAQEPADSSAATQPQSTWIVDVPGHYETRTREVPYYELQPIYKDVTVYIADDGFESEDYAAAQEHQKSIGGGDLGTRNKKVETGTQRVQNGTTTETYQEWVPEQGHWS